MQEDIQIGDIFLYAPPDSSRQEKAGTMDSPTLAPASLWLNRLGAPPNPGLIYEALTGEYCTRFRIQPTPIPAVASTNKTESVVSKDASSAATDASSSNAASSPPSASIDTIVKVNGLSSEQTIKVPSAAKSPAKPSTKKPLKSTPLPTYASRCPPKPGANAIAATQAKATGSENSSPPYSYDIGNSGSATDFRMHRVELPEITVASVTNAELAAAVPTYGLLAKIGLGVSSDIGLDISLSGIEEVHLPFNREFDVFEEEKSAFAATVLPPGTLLAYLNQKRPDLLEDVCYIDDVSVRALNASGLLLMVANQVVYAHGVDYSYKSSTTLAGQLGVALAAAAGASKASTSEAGTGGTTVTTTVTNDATTAASPGSSTTSKPSETSVPSATTESVAQTALAAEAAKIAGLTGTLSSPGGELQAGIGRSGNFTLSDKFPEPLAVGIGDLLEYAPSELLRLYRNIVVLQGNSQNAFLILQSLDKFAHLYCPGPDKANPRSLEDYVRGVGPDMNVFIPHRFQPRNDLPKGNSEG